MQPELQAVADEASKLWWRVPLTLTIVLSIPTLLSYALDRPEEHPLPPSPSHPPVARPGLVFGLRTLSMFCVARFGWIFFASIDRAWFYELSKMESLLWCFYFFILLPFWVGVEVETKEALRNLRSASGSNP